MLAVLTIALAGAGAGIGIWLADQSGAAEAAGPATTAETAAPPAATETAPPETGETEPGTTAETQEAPETETGGGGGEGDAAAGEEVWLQAGCGSCHTLAAAGSTGTIGPNLDQAQPSYDLVVERVTNGAGAMPAFGRQGILDEQQIQDVAAYVVQSTQG